MICRWLKEDTRAAGGRVKVGLVPNFDRFDSMATNYANAFGCVFDRLGDVVKADWNLEDKRGVREGGEELEEGGFGFGRGERRSRGARGSVSGVEEDEDGDGEEMDIN